ncbi:hypothetical protein FLAG1_09066 [Fusarium langsethiae]|uniref:Uncharacterized protein n=1 Tax=Fusarium langsethiae TaxID=179993 RepID=A0A0N0DCE8_FUSLA|nr:hypothetical protein FLAG1_09066 [Fusarium langsethiae]GKU06666.1 unnamed protein product [Fusarium langsethiae]GKU21852.1 unnamed protein product [Fusarium langsethiae]
MVRLSIVTIIFTVISSAAAVNLTKACQCLYSDGSHCCVLLPQGSCQDECRNAGKGSDKCNADGKYSNVSWFTGVGRTKCVG